MTVLFLVIFKCSLFWALTFKSSSIFLEFSIYDLFIESFFAWFTVSPSQSCSYYLIISNYFYNLSIFRFHSSIRQHITLVLKLRFLFYTTMFLHPLMLLFHVKVFLESYFLILPFLLEFFHKFFSNPCLELMSCQ